MVYPRFYDGFMSSETKLSHNKFILSIVIIIALAASFATCYFATPTVFGGRDQGAIATAAINLAKYKSFTFSTPVSEDLFQKYGPGKALNYPGFDYTKDGKLISRFPKAYTIYLAGCYSLLGLKGIQYANFPLLFLFLVIFWLILRHFFSEEISFAGFLVAATFFPFLWFAKYALTEILMLFLVWAGIYFLILLCRCPTPTNSKGVGHLIISLTAFGLSALVRIEGIIFFLLAVFYVLFLQKKKNIPESKNFKKYLLLSTLFLLVVYLYLNFPTLLDSAKNIIKAFLPGSAKESAPSANLYFYLLRIFFNYGILVYLVLGLAGIVRLAMKFKKNWTKPEFIPVLILFPSFFYFVSPLVTLDDPWIFRRFVFAVFPVLVFCTIYFLDKFFRHKIFLYLSLVILIAANAVVSWRFLPLSENKNLLPQVEKISRKFKPNDLILVDRLASGSGYSLISEPLNTLYNRQAVYFFNADDLKYIRQGRYENIYLVAPLVGENPWYAGLAKGKMFDMLEVDNNFLEPPESKFGLAVNVEAKTPIGIWKLK